MYKNLFIYVAIGAILYYVIYKAASRSKYIDFFKDIGFSQYYLSQFKTSELEDMYSYINNYARKGIVLKRSDSEQFYDRLKEIERKYTFNFNI